MSAYSFVAVLIDLLISNYCFYLTSMLRSTKSETKISSRSRYPLNLFDRAIWNQGLRE